MSPRADCIRPGYEEEKIQRQTPLESRHLERRVSTTLR